MTFAPQSGSRPMLRTASLPLLSVPLLGLAALTGCGKPVAVAKKPVVPTVTITTPTRKAVDVYGEYVGQLDSPQTVEIRARVLGFVKEIKFKDGTEVNAGDLLFVID